MVSHKVEKVSDVTPEGHVTHPKAREVLLELAEETHWGGELSPCRFVVFLVIRDLSRG